MHFAVRFLHVSPKTGGIRCQTNGHHILNPASGQLHEVELFVASLSYSSYFFAEFTLSQRLEDFITSQNHMFFYFKGVPQYAVPDNCKTAISKADRYDPLSNCVFQRNWPPIPMLTGHLMDHGVNWSIQRAFCAKRFCVLSSVLASVFLLS